MTDYSLVSSIITHLQIMKVDLQKNFIYIILCLGDKIIEPNFFYKVFDAPLSVQSAKYLFPSLLFN